MRKSKLIAITAVLAVIAFSSVSCAKPKNEDIDFDKDDLVKAAGNSRNAAASNKGVIEIREKMFAAQVGDVYINADDYLGKTIKLEGIFKKEQWGDPLQTYCFVVRYGPGGCCGFDANIGFEVAWDGERTQQYPAAETWVEAAGVLKTYEEDGYAQYLYLDLSSLNVLNRRGLETVRQ